MNISPQNIKGTCHYKCDYSFEYPISSCTAANNGNAILLSYNAPSSVTYNNIKYDVLNCNIYSPSIHLYNNLEADGEFIITHNPSSGGNPMYVCIPISTNGSSNNATKTITEIVNAVSSGAPSQGETVSQGISDFGLNDFIPIKEYYNYSTDSIDVIAFGIQQAIYISASSLESLQKSIIKNTSTSFLSGSELFLSSGRPVHGAVTGNEIYIDCQPTNESEEQINQVTEIKSETNYNMNTGNILTNPAFLLFISSLIFIVIILGVQKLISYLSK
jgi:hypothetical protein